MIPIVVLQDMRILANLKWKLIVFLRRLHFPSMRLLYIIDLKIGISLKDLDYRVTPPESVHTSLNTCRRHAL
jgi:hypothetical protein